MVRGQEGMVLPPWWARVPTPGCGSHNFNSVVRSSCFRSTRTDGDEDNWIN